MFRRGARRTIFANLRELIWPSMGWRRAARYTKHRIVRMSGSASSIARGLALGISISFSPLLGTHFIQVAAIGWFLRANILAGLAATFFCNPWTIPFIWWASIAFGAWMFNLFHMGASVTVPEHMDFGMFWHIVTHEPMRIFWPWMAGGYAIALISYPFSYALFYHLVDNAKKARVRARLRRRREIARGAAEGAGP